MKVEIWSDVICPWCGIGDKRLQDALSRFEHAGDVEVVHRSFQLDPSAPEGVTKPVKRMLEKKYRMDPVNILAMTRRVEEIAAKDGLVPYVAGDNVTGNTFLAHQLLAFATARGKGPEAWSRLFKAYFGEVKSIFDVPSLVALSVDLGFDAEETRVALVSGQYADSVRQDAEEARKLGCTGVPFVVVDRRYGVAGAQPVDVFLRTLDAAWRERSVSN